VAGENTAAWEGEALDTTRNGGWKAPSNTKDTREEGELKNYEKIGQGQGESG